MPNSNMVGKKNKQHNNNNNNQKRVVVFLSKPHFSAIKRGTGKDVDMEDLWDLGAERGMPFGDDDDN